jgi:predicted negative regulator of RcsB-dependent stress response
MRVVVVIVIIGGLIWLGWRTPFKQRFDEAKRTITSELNDLSKKQQKNQDASVKRH